MCVSLIHNFPFDVIVFVQGVDQTEKGLALGALAMPQGQVQQSKPPPVINVATMPSSLDSLTALAKVHAWKSVRDLAARMEEEAHTGAAGGEMSRTEEIAKWPGGCREWLHVKLLQLTALLRMRLLKDAVALTAVVGDLDQSAYNIKITQQEYSAATGGVVVEKTEVDVSAVSFELRLVIATMPHYVAG